MPRFTLRFIGMSLFVRHRQDAQVDVRFVTRSHRSSGHGHRPEDQHVPVLLMSPESWAGTNESGRAFPDRAPGRPIYLSQFESVDIRRGGNLLPGPVAVSNSGPVTTVPTTTSGWNNFEELIPRLSHIYPNGTVDPQKLRDATPSGVISLTGGVLGSEPPSHPNGEGPWDFVDPVTQKVERTRFLTDVAVYSFDFAGTAADAVTMNLQAPRGGPSIIITFKPNVDITGWVANEPFLAALAPIQSHEVLHLGSVAGVLRPDGLAPRVVRVSQKDPKPFLHPDDRTCPPAQIQL